MRNLRYKKRPTSFLVVFIICLFFITIGIGYSYLRQSLNITGTATIAEQNVEEYVEGNSTYLLSINKMEESVENCIGYEVCLNVSNMDKDMSSCMISFDVPNSYNSVISECVDNSIMSYKDGRVTISSSSYFAKGDKLELKLKLYLNDFQEMKISRLAINNLLMKSE